MHIIKRKVIQIAGSTCLVSLPKKWVTEHNVKKGDELSIDEQGNKLLVSTEGTIDLGTKIIDVTGMDRTTIIFALRSAYRQGYDTINVEYKSPLTKHLRTGEKKTISSIIHEEISRMVGVEVIQQKETSCILKSISSVSSEDFNNILRRIFILLKDAFIDLNHGLKRADFDLIQTIKERHDNITKFISYSLRMLNKKGHTTLNDATSMHALLLRLEEIIDILKWTARHALEQKKSKFSEKSIELLDQVAVAFEQFYDLFYKFEYPKLAKLYQLRHEVINKFDEYHKDIPRKELFIVHDHVYILEILVAMTESRMSLSSL